MENQNNIPVSTNMKFVVIKKGFFSGVLIGVVSFLVSFLFIIFCIFFKTFAFCNSYFPILLSFLVIFGFSVVNSILLRAKLPWIIWKPKDIVKNIIIALVSLEIFILGFITYWLLLIIFTSIFSFYKII